MSFPNVKLAKVVELLSGSSPEHPTSIASAAETAGFSIPVDQWTPIPVEAVSAGDIVCTADGDLLVCLAEGKLMSESGEEFDADEVSLASALRAAE